MTTRPASQPRRVRLSHAQQRFWFQQALDPDSPSFNLPLIMRLRGPLDAALLRRGVRRVVDRHDALRTSVTTDDGHPAQMVWSEVEVPFDTTDLAGVAGPDRAGALDRLIEAELATPIDLRDPPPFRARLVRLTPEEHVFVLIVHHMMFDGWSSQLFVDELCACYAALADGGDPRPPGPALGYADYAEREPGSLSEDRLRSAVSYWRDELAGAKRLRYLFERPTENEAGPGNRSSGTSVRLDDDVVSALDEVSRRLRATPFMVLLAVFDFVLARLSDADDVVVGVPFATRDRPELQSMIGVLLNTLPVRARVAADSTFEDLVRGVRGKVLDAIARQDVPFDLVAEKLADLRDPNHHELFDVVFNFVRDADSSPSLPGVTVELEESSGWDAKFSLTLYARQDEDGVRLDFVHRNDALSEERARCLAGQYAYALEQLVADPGKRLESVSLASPDAAVPLPDPAAPFPRPAYPTVAEAFAGVVAARPQAPALRWGADGVCSYGDLAAATALVAGLLDRHGVGRGDVVAVYGHRSPGVVAGFLGVLLGGRVVMLVDAALPPGRTALMLAQADARCCLVVGDELDEQALGDVPRIRVDDDVPAQASGEAPAVPGVDLDPDDPAYVFFTSGSSGTPKAVLGTHAGLSHFLSWQRREFDVGPHDRCGLTTALSFDVVLRDLLLPLTSGATLCVPEDGAPPSEVFGWIRAQSITLMHAVPSLVASWMATPGAEECPTLRLTFFAGEPLTDSVVREWRHRVGSQCRVVNLYGPTETTLAKAFAVVDGDVRRGVQPVGRPLPETQLLVVSPSGHLCAPGEIGEIVIRTPFATKGYLGPSAPAGGFRVNPFTGQDRDVVYFTGDRGRYRPDGALEVLGRLDAQLKVAGVRIEPGEIEAVLREHPKIGAAAVGLRSTSDGREELTAWVVSRDTALDSLDLVRHCQAALPTWMLPSKWIVVERLPLLPNAKLDRDALSSLDGVSLARPPDSTGPRDLTELAVARIWEDLLGLERVGIATSFFELGGTSLLALQLATRLGALFEQTPRVRAIFEHPTIEEQAALFRRESLPDQDAVLVTIQEGSPDTPPLAIVHGAGGEVCFTYDLARTLGPGQRVVAFQSVGLYGERSPLATVEEMARVYLEEWRGSEDRLHALGGHSMGAVVAFEMARQLEAEGIELPILVMMDQAAPVDDEDPEESAATDVLYDAMRGLDAPSFEEFVSLTRQEQVECILDRWKRGHVVPKDSDVEYVSRFLTTIQNNIQAVRDYRPGPYSGRVLILRARGSAREGEPLDLGWSEHLSRQPDVVIVPGTHEDMLREPHVREVAAVVREALTAG